MKNKIIDSESVKKSLEKMGFVNQKNEKWEYAEEFKHSELTTSVYVKKPTQKESLVFHPDLEKILADLSRIEGVHRAANLYKSTSLSTFPPFMEGGRKKSNYGVAFEFESNAALENLLSQLVKDPSLKRLPGSFFVKNSVPLAADASNILLQADTEKIMENNYRDIERAAILAEINQDFEPRGIEDARKKTIKAIVLRQGQPAFRRNLLDAYGHKCAVSDCAVTDVLEAAHIISYKGPETNHVANGLLLRADIHTLFDLGLVAIDEQKSTVILAPALRESSYGELHGKSLRLPSDPSKRPSSEALRLHRDRFGL